MAAPRDAGSYHAMQWGLANGTGLGGSVTQIIEVSPHAARDKGIPPFLILHVAGHPDVTAQARRLAAALNEADIPATVFGARETTHNRLNANVGRPDDPATEELFEFLDPLLGETRR